MMKMLLEQNFRLPSIVDKLASKNALVILVKMKTCNFVVILMIIVKSTKRHLKA